MIRVILFLSLLAVIALGAAWLAERPGEIAVTWMGWRIETSIMVALAALVVLFIIMLLAWSLLRFILRSPRLLAQSRREKRRLRGQRAVARGLLAVASGDMRGARRFTAEADRFAGEESLALLLRAQMAQLAGDRARADAAFRSMVERPETRLLGLRGLYVEAQRRGDADAGRRHAEEAARSAPALPWAGQAVLEFRSAAGDWAGALTALDANLRSGLIERATYRRQRAVLLTARALELEQADPVQAKRLALEAVKFAPDLVPAAALAARLSAEAGEGRRAARIIEAAWRAQPHPDLADIYAYLRSGDSVRDRLARVRQLARLRPDDRESILSLARAALDAKEFSLARQTLAPLTERPTQRVAMLMAELEEAEHGDSGRAREWMARALRAAGDPRWVADGMVSDRWLPVSPVTGRLDAFEWKPPMDEIAAPGPLVENRAAGPERQIEAMSAAAALTASSSQSGSAGNDSAADEVGASPPAASPSRQGSAPTAEPPVSNLPQRSVASTPRKDAVIPLIHAPDDPGPSHDPNAPAAGSAHPGRANLRPSG